MALSFSFPSGKVKTAERNLGSSEQVASKSHLSLGPKSWRSFPSLSFFKESFKGGSSDSSGCAGNPHHTHTTTNKTHLPPTFSKPHNSKLPIRIAATSIITDGDGSFSGGTTTQGVHKGKAPAKLSYKSLATASELCRKSLPDVTDTDSTKPQISYSAGGKPCDLVAQLKSLDLSRLLDRKVSSEGPSKGDAVVMSEVKASAAEVPTQSFDDNGNPRRDSDQGTEACDHSREFSVKALDGSEVTLDPNAAVNEDDAPLCFINATDLSEDPYGALESSDEVVIPKKDISDQCEDSVDMNLKGGRKHSVGSSSNNDQTCTPKVRPKVPASKSYPDIVQTTFSTEESHKVMSNKTISKDNSDLDSLLADSLENLASNSRRGSQDNSLKEKLCDDDDCKENVDEKEPMGQPTMGAEKPFKAFENAELMGSAMTESQMGGLFAEKPPEAWTIDLNSLSLDSEMEMSRKSHNSGSNSNSLAYFVNLNDATLEQQPERLNSMESSVSSNAAEKKIFSMFVDIREGGSHNSQSSSGKKPSIIPKPKPVVNKPVLSVMETSTGSLKSMSRRFPSPIFQHRAAAEAARKAARLEWEKQKEKYYDSLEPSSMMANAAGAQIATGPATAEDKEGNPMADSTVSNRSSLHVANVLDSSFSSSIISSLEASQPGELEICQGGPCFKLGKDLLRMFQEGINTDVIIAVNGKVMRAHKCILASRSQYFAAILSGHWVEKAGNTINLDGFSYNVVQFALYHIYSGTNEIPDTIDLLELATLTDLLGLEGLRENISQTFRVKFCHNFHRPCTGCITGVLECFPIATAYGMDELHRKMIKWICKHFVRIWPTKGFAGLGEELMDKCLRYNVNHLSVENILDHTLGCDQLLTTMPTLRWTESIFNLVNHLAEECVHFLGDNLHDVLQSQKFLQFGKGQAWNISRIEGTFLQALTLLKPDVACLSHTALTRLIELGTETIDEVEWSASFVDFIKMLRDEVEKYLLANASKVVLSKCWEDLGQAVRKRICSNSFVGFDKFGNKIVKNTGAATQSSTGTKNRDKTTPHSDRNEPKTLTTRSKANAKVASVRPIQSQQKKDVEGPASRRTVDSTNKPSRNFVLKREHTLESDSRPSSSKSSSTTEKEKSRRASTSTASPTPSAARTPMKPLTPSATSKPSPLTGDLGSRSTARSTKTTRPSAVSRKFSSKPQEPPKKPFLTNSAKAAAVSKPQLRPSIKRTPSSSASSLNSQGTSQSTKQTPKQTNLTTVTSRYLANHEKSGSFSARSSFSNLERPQVKAKVDSNPPRRNTCSQMKNTRQTSVNLNKRPTSTGSNATRKNVNNAKASATNDYSSMPPVINQLQATNFENLDSLNDSCSRDSLMSKSTIEIESGEVKMRTLAEIGRSSTFSKDEPTILNKMEGSGYGNLDYEEYE